jgi:rhomboid protease GluP
VAICGLVGALAVSYSLRGTRRDLRLLQLLIPVAALVLCVLTNNHGVGLAVGCVLGVPLAGRLGRPAENGTHRADRHLGLDR